MNRYVVGIAGAYTHWEDPDTGVLIPRPTDCTVTYIPDYSWPVWHAAFGREDLTGLWWYAQAVDVLPTLGAALRYFEDNRAALTKLVHPEDWRGVDGNRLVLERIILDLNRHPDTVIAWGKESV